MSKSKQPKYQFKCSTCGLIEVEENHFLKFLNSELESEINKQFKLGSPGAIINFTEEKDCPLCRPNGEHKGVVLIISPNTKVN